VTSLPPLLLTYYGDDFTGSTDVMEALALAGLRTLLFLNPPRPEELARFPGVRAVGVAGTSRSMAPERMDQELPPVFAAVGSLGAPLVHYKVCSTFDSSPRIGSIGRALELGQAALRSAFVPLVVGAPALGRYCAFGNLFARSGLESEVFRLDRHPTMSRHPTTPMDESDLRLLLARQTGKRVGLMDAVHLESSPEARQRQLDALLAGGAEAVLFDTVTDEHLAAIGRLLWNRASPERPLFAVGSSGLEYALVAHWRREGLLDEGPGLAAAPVDRIAVVSGSCSPVTARQIAWAVEHGFAELSLAPERLVDPEAAAGECAAAAGRAVRLLQEGRSVLLHTSRGPDDPRIALTARRVAALGGPVSDVKRRTGELLGGALGRILRSVMQETGLRRAATTGGDTSGYVARALGIEALETAAPCAPGSPLCRISAPGAGLDGREIVFKGGQVGKIDFFGRVLSGRS